MIKRNMFRLVIYLVISISLIILLWNLNQNSKTPTQNLSDQELIIPVQPLPNCTDCYNGKIIVVTIDSQNRFYVNRKKIEKKSLVKELLQEFKHDNISDKNRQIMLHVDKTVDSQHIIYVLDLANKYKWTVKVMTN